MKTPEQMEEDRILFEKLGYGKRYIKKEWDYDWECCGNKLMKRTLCPTCKKKQYHRRKNEN